ncbi:N-acetylmannosamine-6-phosphate 2-epimerase [Rhizobium tumorigenes]|uniref:N-acetylmannosamine-6-phosphate 2-epimerase n=1 Tax=Rhizobium tumorigenes TaxID=2041385 RepID=UPI00241C63B1|nr:N-acetylmannosamine-6-phosphate 2-epimerase [Rhizobium tumorigenes]WFR99571.1 N-acetylmannosamine-6-phosphate 2-epimerase [Rhizobium tumorigenes]
MIDILGDLRGGLAVSCQAAEDSRLHQTHHIVAFARAAIMDGAKDVRIAGIADFADVCGSVTVPVIGITKIAQAATDVYITPSLSDVRKLCEAGADIVAFDATKRPRPSSVPELIAEIRWAGRIVMADISTLDEAAEAMDARADFVGTTPSGYAPYSAQVTSPDFVLMRELSSAWIPLRLRRADL